MASDKSEGLATIFRGLVILEWVAQTRKPVSATEVVEACGLPRPSVNRILRQLEQEGFLQREPVKRRYLPGPRARGLVMDLMSNQALGAARHRILQALSDEIEETCNCTLLDGHETVYFDRVESNWPFRIQLPVGSRLPLHCTASGKLYLAHMEPRQRQRLLIAAPLRRYTDRTITDPESLQQALDRIRESGVGVDNQEFMDGMAAVAVPVINDADELCFTVAVHAPTVRKSLDALRQYLPSLRNAAASMASTYCGATST